MNVSPLGKKLLIKLEDPNSGYTYKSFSLKMWYVREITGFFKQLIFRIYAWWHLDRNSDKVKNALWTVYKLPCRRYRCTISFFYRTHVPRHSRKIFRQPRARAIVCLPLLCRNNIRTIHRLPTLIESNWTVSYRFILSDFSFYFINILVYTVFSNYTNIFYFPVQRNRVAKLIYRISAVFRIAPPHLLSKKKNYYVRNYQCFFL